MLNLDKINKLQNREIKPSNHIADYKPAVAIEVLKNGDLIYSSMNLGHKVNGEWLWSCGFCKEFTLHPILDYRCENCDSKVIKVGDDKHIFYQKYMDRYQSLGKLEATADEDNQEG